MTPGWWGVCGRRLRFGGRCDPALDHDRRRRRGAGPVVVPDRASWTGGGCGAGEGWGLGGWPSRQPSPAKPDPSRLKGGGVPPPASAHWSSLLGHQCFGGSTLAASTPSVRTGFYLYWKLPVILGQFNLLQPRPRAGVFAFGGYVNSVVSPLRVR